MRGSRAAARSSALAARLGLAALTASGACSHAAGTPPPVDGSCAVDADCAGARACASGSCACVSSVCLRATAWPGSFFAEVTPSITGTPGPIELANPRPTSNGLIASLAVPDPVTVQATFNYPALTPAPAETNVALAVRTSIPGHPDVAFDSLSIAGGGASWTLPAWAFGVPAALRISPRAPDDAALPAHTFALSVNSAMAIDLATDPLVSISGRLLSAAGDVLPAPLAARAFARGEAASNFPALASGAFVLLVSASTAASTDGLLVEVGPVDVTPHDPTFTFVGRPYVGNTDLGTIKLPAYTAPQQFGLTVVGDGAGGPPVRGAFVRLTTALPDSDAAQAAAGKAEFVADATTDASGAVNVALLPGISTLRNYQVAVVPPPGSLYATTCFPQVVGPGGGPSLPVVLQPNKVLPRRPVFSGTVHDANGSVVPDVRVTATPSHDPLPGCLRIGPAPASALAAGGRFSLPLDPGTYQIDYDPPAGTPAPRLTEWAVTIDADVDRAVTLPAGSVIDGVVTAGGGPLVNATVRIFEPRCVSVDDCFGQTRTAPWLRAEVLTTGDGTFRAIVAAPGE